MYRDSAIITPRKGKLMRSDLKKTIFEFFRYAVVGGISAVIDMGVNYAMLYYILKATKDDTAMVAVSVAAGFIVGLAANFILSNIFVFKSAEQKEKGKTFGAFAIYVAVGVIGFGITELLTILGTSLIGDEGIWYLLLSCCVKGVVLVWNYLGRKIFVYRGK